jgi:MFS family permease
MTNPSPETSPRTFLARSWLVVATAGSFYFFQLVLQALPSVIREGLVVDFSLSQAGFGGLSSSFYYPYILLQVPAGLLVLRFGARALLIFGIILCTLACFLTAYLRDLFWVEVARILMGLGSAPTFVGTATLAASWFPLAMLPIVIALIEALGMLGPALGQEVLGWIVQTSGWRTGMLACGWFGLLLFMLILLLVRNSPAAEEPAGDAATGPSGLELAKILLSVRLVLVGLVGGMIYSAGLALAMLWGVPFFQVHMSLVQASFCASFFSWGIVIGLPLFGWACGRLAGPLPLLASGAIMTALSIALILYGPASYLVFSLGMFFCGIANGSYALTFVVVGASVPRRYTSAAFGFANMAILAVGGLLFQPLIGILARMRGLVVPDADALSVLLWAQAIGLLLLLPLARRSREEPPAPDLKTV